MPWVDRFLEQVAEAFEGHAPGSISWRYDAEENELRVAPAPVEVVGGAADGGAVFPAYWLNLSQVIGAFDAMPAVEWNTLDNEVCCEGRIGGEEAWVIFSREPFEDETPRQVLDRHGQLRKRK